MKLAFCILLVCATCCVEATNKSLGTADAILETPPADGTFMEMLLDRLDQMDHKLLQLQHEMSEHREEVERNRLANEMTSADFLWAIHRLEQDVSRNMSLLQDRSLVILDQQKSCANHDRLREKLFAHVPKQNLSQNKTHGPMDAATPTSPQLQLDSTTSSTTPPTTTTTTHPTVGEPTTYASCKDAPANISGVYLIRINNVSSPFKVWCEQMEFGGGWIVIQHRFDGSVDFFRNWTEYREGFGEMDKEFWLGLEHIHQLTTARKYELLVEIKDFNGTYGYARYNSFQVGSETDQYSLKSLGSYSGTAGHSLVSGYKFSTPDRNNGSGSNYAVYNEGPWWHPGISNLNGRYKNTADKKSI
ncbi:angiopoietin-related protein 1-like [Anopheles darlingi]|uniref:angiopoietin-related protein 1-like n=1 Tax=Anopheles darlingi TaxID=43151 RepID=UPI0021002A43|nr:angiopoietin-related protein 1-like [Anopheles darlingi]